MQTNDSKQNIKPLMNWAAGEGGGGENRTNTVTLKDLNALMRTYQA